MHVRRGALDSGFGAFEDEAAHFVSGLMVHDYVLDPEPLHPLRYAERYYLHYPKVAIGQWPPVFYVLQAAWTLVFGATPLSLVLLMSFLEACVAVLVAGALVEETGPWIAGGAAVVYALLPLVQTFGARIMTEVPNSLFCLAAALAFGKYLDTGRLRHNLAFALLAVLAILTKGNAFALAVVPPLAILGTRRWSLLRTAGFWVPAVAVAVACLPWYALTSGIAAGTWAGGTRPNWTYTREALPFYALWHVHLGGWAVGFAAIVGMGAAMTRPSRRGRWWSVLALVPGFLAVHSLVPTNVDERHMVLVAPAWAILAGLGTRAITEHVPWGVARRYGLVPLALALGFAVQGFEFPRKEYSGYRAVARELLAREDLDDAVFLIASDSIGEGLFVGGVAISEERPGHVVLRASKVLGRADWMGRGYEPLFRTEDEVDAFLRGVPVAIVLLDLATKDYQWFTHHELLRGLLQSRPDAWELVAKRDVTRRGIVFQDALLVYELRGHRELPRREVTYELASGGR